MSDSQGTPWPQYGENSGGSNAPQGSYQQPAGQEPNYPGMQNFPAPSAVPTQQMPGRGMPITLIVVGAILTLIVSFLLTMIIAISSFHMPPGDPIANGETLSVTSDKGNGTEDIFVSVSSQSVTTCTLQSTSSDTTYSSKRMDPLSALFFQNVKEGEYVINCNGDTSSMGTLTDVEFVNAILKSAVGGIIAGTVVGIAGIAMFIVGIVILVRRNKVRRRIINAARFPNAPLY